MLEEGVEGFIPSRHLIKEDGNAITKGETADFKVIEFNKEFKRIVLSHTNIFKEIEAKNIKDNKKKQTAAKDAEKSTLGDLDALAELKKKMEGN